MTTETTQDLLHVTSRDGTDIAIDRSGSGPAFTLVSGVLVGPVVAEFISA
jgi:hypothetical protein